MSAARRFRRRAARGLTRDTLQLPYVPAGDHHIAMGERILGVDFGRDAGIHAVFQGMDVNGKPQREERLIPPGEPICSELAYSRIDEASLGPVDIAPALSPASALTGRRVGRSAVRVALAMASLALTSLDTLESPE